jgi:heme A synthase
VNGYVAGGYGVTALIIVAYAWRTLRRGRHLSQAVPDEERTWR